MKDRLKEIRKALGLKQREVAERLGVPVGAIGNWEAGRPMPDARIYQLCNEYRVNREWLEHGTGPMFAPNPEADRIEDIERAFCRRVFDSLPADVKRKVLDLMREQIKLDKDARNQTNFGSIGGDMIQN